jgi:hypothetical protein
VVAHDKGAPMTSTFQGGRDDRMACRVWSPTIVRKAVEAASGGGRTRGMACGGRQITAFNAFTALRPVG